MDIVDLSTLAHGGNGSGPQTVIAVAEALQPYQERLAELELALEDRGWVQMAMFGAQEFSRDGLGHIVELARLMYRKNPLINRGVEVQRLYVWGQGVAVSCDDDRANEAVQQFIDDPGNQRALTGQQAASDAEKELQIAGNVFLACFLPASSVDLLRVRTIPFEEVVEVVCNPEDRSDPWYYKRSWSEQRLDPTNGTTTGQMRTAYYPDWRYEPTGEDRPEEIGGNPVEWKSPVYAVKVGGFASDAFGTSEVYAALDWARLHRENLENWASITKSLARFAWKGKVTGGAQGVATAKTKLGTTVTSSSGETNPPPLPGSVLITSGENTFDPIRTAGATSSPADSRFLLLQVCAALGKPEFFFGNADVGNYATSKTLDRPTEMQFAERQRLWRQVWLDLCTLACESRGITPSEPIDVVFPPMLEHDVGAAISALVKGATLGGKASVVIPDMAELARLVYGILGIDDADEKIAAMFPDGAPSPQVGQQEAQLANALADLREALVKATGDA